MTLDHPILIFLALFAATYVITVGAYFVIGCSLEWINARSPSHRLGEAADMATRGPEIRQSLKSLLATSACFAGGVLCQIQGWALTPVASSTLAFVGLFAASVVLHDAWFYFGHRLMHTKPLYRWHKLHHSSVRPTAWSNDNFTVADAISVQSFFLLIPFILPVPLEVLIAHRVFDQAKGMIGHCGYEYFASWLTRWPSPFLCTVHHHRHHATFRYNFANQFTILDRLFGTLEPDYDERVRACSRRQPGSLEEI